MKSETKKITIDANKRALGRVASEVATILMGKDNPAFQRHILTDVRVHVKNASQLQLSQKKRGEKEYTRYTGYPGGLRKESLGSLIDRRGYEEVMRKAVRGMLPNNKLRAKMLKNLTVEE